MAHPSRQDLPLGMRIRNVTRARNGVPKRRRSYHGTPFFTAKYEITAAQAETLAQFRDNPGQFGFDKENYHALTNSCVDFVWKALETIGMNPLKKHGDVLPTDNADDFLLLRNPAIRPPLPAPVSWLSDMWDSLRTPDCFPTLCWGSAFEAEVPQGTITVGPLGQPVPANTIANDVGTPMPRPGATTDAPATPPTVEAPTWSGWQYGDCLVWDDPSPGVDRSDHSLCQRFYGSFSVRSLNQALSSVTAGSVIGAGRNDAATSSLA